MLSCGARLAPLDCTRSTRVATRRVRLPGRPSSTGCQATRVEAGPGLARRLARPNSSRATIATSPWCSPPPDRALEHRNLSPCSRNCLSSSCLWLGGLFDPFGRRSAAHATRAKRSWPDERVKGEGGGGEASVAGKQGEAASVVPRRTRCTSVTRAQAVWRPAAPVRRRSERVP
jgi:hypothetical protein